MKNLLHGSIAFIEATKNFTELLSQLVLEQINFIETHHQEALQKTLQDPFHFLDEDSLVHQDLFPYIVLSALQQDKITALQFGTLMKLWGRVKELNASEPLPTYVPLFLSNHLPNPEAQQYLLECFSLLKRNSGFIAFSSKEQLKKLYDEAHHISFFEQGFWLEKKISPAKKSDKKTQTITERIKLLGLPPLALPDDENDEDLIVSFGLLQTWLNTTLPYPVKLNPVLGPSTVKAIREGSLKRHRDIGLPFPGIELPKTADGYLAPSVLDFITHDTYHSLRASRVSIQETETFIMIADRLSVMQHYLNYEIKKLNQRHKETLHLIRARLNTLTVPVTAQSYLLKKINQERSVIATLKKVRLELGRLKFCLYDMEPVFSGGKLDFSNTPHWSDVDRICFILANLEHLINFSNNYLLDCTARLVAHAVQDVFPISKAILDVYCNEIKQTYFITWTSNQLAFERGLREHPSTLLPIVWQSIKTIEQESEGNKSIVVPLTTENSTTEIQKNKPCKEKENAYAMLQHGIDARSLLLLIAILLVRKVCSSSKLHNNALMPIQNNSHSFFHKRCMGSQHNPIKNTINIALAHNNSLKLPDRRQEVISYSNAAGTIFDTTGILFQKNLPYQKLQSPTCADAIR